MIDLITGWEGGHVDEIRLDQAEVRNRREMGDVLAAPSYEIIDSNNFVT